jgi:hypothetical protein
MDQISCRPVALENQLQQVIRDLRPERRDDQFGGLPLELTEPQNDDAEWQEQRNRLAASIETASAAATADGVAI